METNNAETSTEATQTNTDSTEVSTDTTSTPEASSIEADKTATDGQSSSEEGTESTETESELYYDFDGEEVSASTVKEWKDNGLRQADYTKKSQANAEMKKGLEAKSLELDKVKENLSESISKLDAVIKAESNPEELAELRDTDPSEYLRKKEELADKQKLSEQAKKDLSDLKEKEQLELTNSEKEKLLEAMPDWRDAKKLKVDMDLMDVYVTENEFTEKDIQALTSHKLTLMALDASKYRALQKDTTETKKQVDKAPNVVKAKVKETKPKSTLKQRFYG